MQVSRREFIKYMTALGLSSVAAGALFSLLGCESGPDTTPVDTIAPSVEPPEVPAGTYLSVVRGESPAELVNTAIKALGGIERFVKPDDSVIIKPNICVAYHSYEYAATTNPEVVAAVVSLCRQAGARQVRVMDSPFGGTAEQAYKRTGIADAVEAVGGEMEIMSPIKFRKTPLPHGQDIKDWPVYGEALDADVLINIPIAKHHGMARLTLGMKNLMGLIQDRPKFHGNLGQRIADLNTLLRPDLTIIDGVRILMNHGPSGGSLDDVKLANTVIASHDIVAADTYAASLFDLTGADIPAIRAGSKMGLGITDLSSLKIEELSV
jgi:uncharacterized protein (DUF362 family)